MISVKFGTRGSALALRQTAMIVEAISEVRPEVDLSTEVFSTSGDRKQGAAAASIGDKRDWIQGLEEAVANGDIDCAVHSAKDVPVEIHPETSLVSVLPRGYPCDVLVLGNDVVLDSAEQGILALPKGAVVGTASVRRRAQIHRLRPDIKVIEVRGNLPTRIGKLYEGLGLSAVVLARAGIERLQLPGLKILDIPLEQLLPAINQGILSVQYRTDRTDLTEIFRAIQDADTQRCFEVERAFIERLGAGCRSAVGVYAEIVREGIRIRTEVIGAEPELKVFQQCVTEARTDMSEMGHLLADEAFSAGAGALLNSWDS